MLGSRIILGSSWRGRVINFFLPKGGGQGLFTWGIYYFKNNWGGGFQTPSYVSLILCIHWKNIKKNLFYLKKKLTNSWKQLKLILSPKYCIYCASIWKSRFIYRLYSQIKNKTYLIVGDKFNLHSRFYHPRKQ